MTTLLSSGAAVAVSALGAAMLVAACASSTAPPAAPAPVASQAVPASKSATEPTTTVVAQAPAPPPPSSDAPAPVPAAAPEASDPCHVSQELAQAYEKFGQGGDQREWTANAREKVLLQEDAERAFTGITQEIISAIAHKRYGKLAAFASSDGVCLRAAKGAECQMLSPRALAACAASGLRTPWAVDGAPGEGPRYTCGEAFRHIFYARDFLHVGKPHFNCFPEPGRGNNASPIVLSGPRLGYVELESDAPDGFRSLWLVFDGTPQAPELVELISDYPRK